LAAGPPAFYGRVIAGLAITTAVPFAVLLATR
jgi:hypothetical protein